MFGISLAEFLVIIVIAVAVIPAKNWPDAARFLARVVKSIRQIIWKITDATEQIKEQIDLENPIDEVMKKTTDDIAEAFRTPAQKRKTKNEKRKTKNDQS